MARVTVIGAGPAGLMAAETLATAGHGVTVLERMPSAARKFLMAGRGGLNLTHSEPIDPFMGRYGPARARLQPAIDAFPPAALTAWAEALGQPVFTGTSGRVFPRAMKASPLLRAWLARLAGQGVDIRTRQDWRGWDEQGRLVIAGPQDTRAEAPDAVVLALGGASWPRLGSTGDWVGWLTERGVPVAPFRPANSGFLADWSPTFADRFAGRPLKGAAFAFDGRTVRGEAMIAAYGLEGGAIYALSAALRGAVERDGRAVLTLDLKPDLTAAALTDRLARPRGSQSLSNHLRKAAGLSPVAIGLLRETGEVPPADPAALAARIKAAPLTLTGVQGLDRAISSAGGVAWDAVDERLMLKALPGVFVAGEMLDWEAPTGGYLLQACFATGATAGRGAADWLARRAAGA
ncbi:MAG: NAD(P)/FAD-dependent oxidoreductase [Brevundimonas sp.]|uniref:NAD(P)/FAD-dependent oxidoreductase n=1 Tax=Brevundimonas sp. TaxID=1871086 RepID=UPI00391AF16E